MIVIRCTLYQQLQMRRIVAAAAAPKSNFSVQSRKFAGLSVGQPFLLTVTDRFIFTVSFLIKYHVVVFSPSIL